MVDGDIGLAGVAALRLVAMVLKVELEHVSIPHHKTGAGHVRLTDQKIYKPKLVL